ncbi:MAG: 1-(5-phosphoribosyl)-5-[(5-phosphoribosylamino)methylideneamino] imidazole-4-carboxamide isomerase [Bacteroidia bacterium]|nr:1-(5-phosphoribosyl)-5-[(5-phosphoribosylamino)methylideneamino] imidazole-4-carboxamide isomerase [Bacteroidia bacterium]
MQVIPAIDVWEGEAVRLWQGDFGMRERFSRSLEAVGQRFLSWGVQRWHVVDLEGAKEGRVKQKDVLFRLRQAFPSVKISLGGGLRTEAEIEWALQAGFDWVVLGSAVVEQPENEVALWLQRWGAAQFIIAADTRKGCLTTQGWQREAPIRVGDFVQQWRDTGIAGLLCTQVERDGTLLGPDVAFYRELQALASPVPIIASGGIRGPQDLESLQAAGISMAIVGKALYVDPTAPEWIQKYIPS